MNGADLVTKTDINSLKSEFKADMRELELRMTIKLGGMIAALCAI